MRIAYLIEMVVMNKRLKSLLNKQYYRATYAKHHGHGYVCNLCGASYGCFVPEYPAPDVAEIFRTNDVVSGYGPNKYCPNCMSTSEERLVKAVIQQEWKIAGKQILHFSPERRLYKWLKKRALMTRVAITAHLPFADGSFSFLIANHVLECLEDDAAAIHEMWRVLNHEGAAILQVLYSETLSRTFEEADMRIYAMKDYINRLEKAGFRVSILTPEALLSFRAHAIPENESFFLCYK
jgi:SAM-dependent methyltransferase